MKTKHPISPVMQTLSRYVSRAATRPLPPAVVEKTKYHIIDTLAAVISGMKLPPGRLAESYMRKLGGTEEAGIPGTSIVTTAVNAAWTAGTAAHADETDDSHQPSNTHPGCAIVPAALAMGERERCDGKTLIRAVAAGYDICTRLTFAFDPVRFKVAGHSNHSFGGLFGASTAAGVIARLTPEQVRWMYSYTAQQAAGIRTFERGDNDHSLKAFVFGGMTAHNGVGAAAMVQHGFEGVDDEFHGKNNRNFFDAYLPGANPKEMARDLGRRYEILNTNIKKWSVGSPVQAALDALQFLMEKHNVTEKDVASLTVTTPDNEAATVDDSPMPDICMQHNLALMLIDGTLTFAAGHEMKRMKDPRVLALRRRMKLVASRELTNARPKRQAIVEIVTRDGRRLKQRTRVVRGTADNPMTRAEVDRKCYDLIAPVTGTKRARSLIDSVWALDKMPDVRALRRYYRT